MSDVLNNKNQVYQFLLDNGYSGAKQTIYNQAKVGGKIPPLRTGPHAGRWKPESVLSDARTHYADKFPDFSPVQSPDFESNKAQESKALRIAENVHIKTERERIKLARERGEVVEIATIERELGVRAKAFRLGLEQKATDAGGQVADLFFGTRESAELLLDRIEGASDPVQAVMDAAHEIGAEQWARLWLQWTEDFLDAYATGRWWTEEMQAAWSAFQHGGEANE